MNRYFKITSVFIVFILVVGAAWYGWSYYQEKQIESFAVEIHHKLVNGEADEVLQLACEEYKAIVSADDLQAFIENNYQNVPDITKVSKVTDGAGPAYVIEAGENTYYYELKNDPELCVYATR